MSSPADDLAAASRTLARKAAAVAAALPDPAFGAYDVTVVWE